MIPLDLTELWQGSALLVMMASSNVDLLSYSDMEIEPDDEMEPVGVGAQVLFGSSVGNSSEEVEAL